MKKISTLLLLILLAVPAAAQAKIVIASGAGYRSLVDKLTATYTAQSGNEVERVYGNMARVTAQARNSGSVDLVLGDKSFLEKADLDCCATQKVGRGRLVIAYPKGKSFNGSDDLLSKDVSRIALPDTKRAIYGKAAQQYLKNKKIFASLEPKLLMVATVPQSASYVVAGEVDYAFINLTHARKIKDSIGGFVIVDETTYSPISIIVEQMSNSEHTAECTAFMDFLKSEEARKIVAAHGMQD
ncbi:molybdate ABC transporter substrate-binding protein [Maridesulfovibrio salexigens]|uniref:Molybdenum ABC transporter, periplasmic molybdate-binding protein n=1 Tax=Maridesulfovibrio salexigens (strain ATCC 14822 / DSM 2638 / NCIMB 8403 / VKM B-1763) TaxID=526222 RepID=C6BWC6_MARSD|nr:molybdate ABC transporter substrate-binding protein [Maridesulfovibrio salexigens]ACS78370.1 molybdenum ABC transporter, periplasmic molybdate-binding protein [Maridesulfovibrio salexigens DSM 2638]